MNIQLNQKEKTIFDSIKAYITETKQDIKPRVAGGWVRDKIMGIKSNDIDITLDTITGHKFVVGFKEHGNVSISSIGVIKSNPEKSKHIEAAAVVIEGLHIDFLQLRIEEYTDGTRIPTVEIGDPKTDAYRRDITINSLFYNIITEEIEDYTGMGVDDIKNKRIRTPLDPYKTFSDDPLRILRVFRFACRFNFNIDHEIYNAIMKNDIAVNLKNKVSNERIGIEMYKIIKNDNAEQGMFKFLELNIVDAIFKPNIDKKLFLNDAKEFYKIYCEFDDKNLERKIFYLYIILYNFIGMKEQQKKPKYLNYLIVKENFKWPNYFTDEIMKIEENLDYLSKLNFSLDIEKVTAIRIVRRLKSQWRNSIVLYIIILRLKNENVRSKYIEELYRKIIEFKCENVYEIRPIIKGSVIIRIFKLAKEQISKFIERSVELQILYDIKNGKELVRLMREDHNCFDIIQGNI